MSSCSIQCISGDGVYKMVVVRTTYYQLHIGHDAIVVHLCTHSPRGPLASKNGSIGRKPDDFLSLSHFAARSSYVYEIGGVKVSFALPRQCKTLDPITADRVIFLPIL